MSGYTQLTREQRYQIQALMKTGQNQAQIAAGLGVHKTTMSRELRRNRGRRGCRPHQAHCLAQARQGCKRRARFTPTTWQQVETLIRQAWSLQQIHGRLQHEHGQTFSHEWIYQHIYKAFPLDLDSSIKCN
jgi:IS30 family transposase